MRRECLGTEGFRPVQREAAPVHLFRCQLVEPGVVRETLPGGDASGPEQSLDDVAGIAAPEEEL